MIRPSASITTPFEPLFVLFLVDYLATGRKLPWGNNSQGYLCLEFIICRSVSNTSFFFRFAFRILYQTADNETTDDKAIIVTGTNGIYKRPAVFKGNVNRDFHNINFVEDHKNVEYDEEDDDEMRPVIPVQNGDIV